MRIAVEGCAHGELDRIYETIELIEKRESTKIDLLLCCGDFQSVRNKDDLESMAVPPKYREMGTFHKYYDGEKIAPVLTVFVGGNHEASSYLQELPYGGWVAQNIYYLGYAGVINIGGLKIGGISGIYKKGDYRMGHHERPPYDSNTIRSAYHIRELDVFRLKQYATGLDIFLSHDWPTGVWNHGNLDELLRRKPFFRNDIETNSLGAIALQELLVELQPKYWFAAHLHCKFAAIVPHPNNNTETKFLALDKCLPKRNFLQVLDIGEAIASADIVQLAHDPKWLTILKLTNDLINVKKCPTTIPDANNSNRFNFEPTNEEIQDTCDKLNGRFLIENSFAQNEPSMKPVMDTLKIQHPFEIMDLLNELREMSVNTSMVDELRLNSSESDQIRDRSSFIDSVELSDEESDTEDRNTTAGDSSIM